MTGTQEIIFIGFPGPSHCFSSSGLAPDNPAAVNSQDRISKPKAAALQVLRLAEELTDMGVPVAILPPHVRPGWEWLENIGFKSGVNLSRNFTMRAELVADFFSRIAQRNPELVEASFLAGSMWAANAATVSPSSDTYNGRIYITPANKTASLHRHQEALEDRFIFKQIFSNSQFITHWPLAGHFSDEGAANHMRFAAGDDQTGFNVFVYGRDHTFDVRDHVNPDPEGKINIPRQTKLASEAIARTHLLKGPALFVKQNPIAINAGAFHNDVVAVSHNDLLFYHEYAFADEAKVIDELRKAFWELSKAFWELSGRDMRVERVSNETVPIKDAINSYLFNSQIVTDARGRTVLIAPEECRATDSVRLYLQKLQARPDRPFDDIIYVPVDESMGNGGGPACLRLRMILTALELASMHQGIRATPDLLQQMRAIVVSDYWDEAHAGLFANTDFISSSLTATGKIYKTLGLKPVVPLLSQIL